MSASRRYVNHVITSSRSLRYCLTAHNEYEPLLRPRSIWEPEKQSASASPQFVIIPSLTLSPCITVTTDH